MCLIFVLFLSLNDVTIGQRETIFESSTIFHCYFDSCQSTEPGGAIFSNGFVGNIDISNTIFHKCSSTNEGGAFYITGSKMKLLKVCITHCLALKGSNAFLFSNEKSIFNIILSSIINSVQTAVCLNKDTASITQSDTSIDGLNSSNNSPIRESGLLYIHHSPSVVFIRVNSERNTGKYLIFISSSLGFSLISESNFINNSLVDSMFMFSTTSRISKCIFIQNKHKSYIGSGFGPLFSVYIQSCSCDKWGQLPSFVIKTQDESLGRHISFNDARVRKDLCIFKNNLRAEGEQSIYWPYVLSLVSLPVVLIMIDNPSIIIHLFSANPKSKNKKRLRSTKISEQCEDNKLDADEA